jgi:hypothetical protein
MTGKHSEDSERPYSSTRAIRESHGIIVWALYRVTRAARYFFPHRWWYCLSQTRCFRKRFTERGTGKSLPVWQDAGVIILLILITSLVWRTHGAPRVGWLGAGLAWWLLADIILYHAGVLWFDDLAPDRTRRALKVFSHRRIFFQGLINFIETVFLFAILYRHYLPALDRPDNAYRLSFGVATTLSAPEGLSAAPAWLLVTHVGVSLFFLVVVISIIASVAYNRGELAP